MPRRLVAIGILFCIGGMAAVADLVVAPVDAKIRLTIPAVVLLPVGIGLLRGSPSARRWAKACIVVGYVFCAARVVVPLLRRDSIHVQLGGLRAEGLSAWPYVAAAALLFAGLLYLLQRLLYSEDVTAYLERPRPGQVTAEGQIDAPRESMLRRASPALGLFFMAPLTAEYLTGYDTSTGDLAALLGGLVILAPLYGGPALIIREVARRIGRGWPTMILLALAFGVFQAGLVDHSLFNASYRDIDWWDDALSPTYIPALGIGAYLSLEFIIGHVIWSISVPIAIVETFVPNRRTTPWLGNLGLAITGVLYLLASALILVDHVKSEEFLPSVPQLIAAAAVVVALIVAAFAVGRRPRPPVDGAVPNPWLVGAVAWVALSLPTLLEIASYGLGVDSSFVSSWWGVGLNVVSIAVLAASTVRWSRRQGWGAAHGLALAGGALLAHVWIAFLVEPLGDVTIFAKLAHNTVFALGAVALLVLAACVVRSTKAAAAGQ